MPILTVDVAPKTIEATTTAAVQAELPGADATLVARLVREATEMIESALGDGRTPRRLARARVTETVTGNDRSVLRLSRVPVLSIDALTLDGAVQDHTAVKIIDPERGEVWLEALWQAVGDDVELRGGWTAQPRPLWAVQYVGGWLMPGDDVTGTVSAATADDSFNDSASGFPPLARAGDWVEAEGFTGANRAFHKVTGTPTTAKIAVTTNLADESAGSTKVLRVRNLPREIERCAIDLVRGLYLARSRDPSVRSEKWSGTEVSFADLVAADAKTRERVIREQLAQWCAPRAGLVSHELVRA